MNPTISHNSYDYFQYPSTAYRDAILKCDFCLLSYFFFSSYFFCFAIFAFGLDALNLAECSLNLDSGRCNGLDPSSATLSVSSLYVPVVIILVRP